MSRCLQVLLLALVSTLSACGGDAARPPALEQIQSRPLRLVIEAEGELKASKATPLTVPGEQWTRRQLVWMKADGSRVEAGELVARFSAAEGELELDKALLDLQRNLLSQQAKQVELEAAQGRVGVDLAQVDTQLGIANRYADADLQMFARNEILDAIQDQRFLGSKRDVLHWQRAQSSERGSAELAVLASQKATYQMNAERRRGDLQALELRAPNAGVLVLSADWSGEKPKLGSALWAGQEFASLPNDDALEVVLTLPQLQAQGLALEQEVQLHPLGRPQQNLRSQLSWIAGAPQQRGRGNPIKYLSMKASVPSEVAKGFGWVPGQAFAGQIVLQQSDAALSVPNLAIIAVAEQRFVDVLDGAAVQRREVKLGVRGPARSEVLEGLQVGDQVLLLPDTGADKDSA